MNIQEKGLVIIRTKETDQEAEETVTTRRITIQHNAITQTIGEDIDKEIENDPAVSRIRLGRHLKTADNNNKRIMDHFRDQLTHLITKEGMGRVGTIALILRNK